MEKVGEFFVGRPSGAVLMAGAGRVYVVEPDGSARWIQEGCGHVHKCALAPDGSLYFANGNLVVGTFENGASKDGPKASAFEITRDKEVVWAFAAEDLNTLTADIL